MVKIKSKKQKRINEKPFNFYGIRETRNPKYMSVTLVREDEDGDREWINAPVNIKNIRVKGDDVYLKLKFLKDEDVVDYSEVASFKSNVKPKNSKDEDDEDLPF